MLARVFRHLLRNFVDNLADLLHGQQVIYDQPLGDYRLEFVVDDVNGVCIRLGKAFDHQVCNLVGAGKLRPVDEPNEFALELDWPLAFPIFSGNRVAAAEKITGLSAHGDDVDVFAGFRSNEIGCGLKDIGIECSGKPLFA